MKNIFIDEYYNFLKERYPQLIKFPDELFHYTSIDAFLGMISNQEIWMTHINFMNDQQEYRHALHTINSITHESLTNYMIKDIENKFAPYCSFSFSEKPDLLSQWRGYCPKGTGICIGFNPSKLFQNNELSFFKCVYDNQTKQKILQEMAMNVVIECLSSKSQEETTQKLKIHDMVMKFACTTFKHQSFEEECEWRILDTLYNRSIDNIQVDENEKTKFRTSLKTLIPYKMKKLRVLDAISAVWVGPSNFQRETKYSVRYCLEMAGVESSRLENIIKLSEIPFVG